MRVAVRTDRGDGPVLVDDVSLQLRRGEVIGLIGESGAGKSTIGLASMGYTRRDCYIVGGDIIFGGADVERSAPTSGARCAGRSIAYIAQSAAASFNPAHDADGAGLRSLGPPRRVEPLRRRAAAIGLFKSSICRPETIGGRYPHQVSGGSCSASMAAMAMVAKPDIVMFDEPTTALDVTTQVECLAAFRKLIREHGAAALYITHDLAVVAQIADRIMVLRRGKMVEFGDARQNPAGPEGGIHPPPRSRTGRRARVRRRAGRRGAACSRSNT